MYGTPGDECRISVLCDGWLGVKLMADMTMTLSKSAGLAIGGVDAGGVGTAVSKRAPLSLDVHLDCPL